MTIKQHIPIFDENFLKKEIEKSWNIVESAIPNIDDIQKSINEWIEQIPYIDNKKEEELKSPFLKSIFNDGLGYLFKLNNERHFVEEKKSEIDGKKTDFALGYFYEENGIVQVVAELKGPNINLDKRQGGDNKFSPVEQAFNYSHKHNGNCKWVIVSDFKEIRLYRANDSCKYEKFVLQDFKEDEYQFKKFIFLLYKDRLIAKNKNSRVETLYYDNKEKKKQDENVKSNIHILDQLNNYFNKFEGFDFIDPNFIAKCEPFYKTHLINYGHYRNYVLFSNNQHIFNLFQKITINVNGDIELQNELRKELSENKIKNFEDKIKYVIDKFNANLIHEIEPQDIRAKKVSVKLPYKNTHCDCLHCNFESFQFDKIITKLDNIKGNKQYSLDEAYMFSKIPIDNYKWTYEAHKSIQIESKENNKQNLLLLATYNLKNLTSIFDNFNNLKRKEIISELKNTDLQYIIHYSLDYATDRDIRNYYLHIIENRFYKNIEYKIDEITENIINFFNNGKGAVVYPTNEYSLSNQFNLLRYYTRQNSLTYDRYGSYSKLIYKIFKSFIVSYATPNECQCKIKIFDYVMLINGIIYIEYDKLRKLLDDYNIDKIEIDGTTLNKLINTTINLLKSVYNSSSFGTTENQEIQHLIKSSRFGQDFNTYFNNLFLVLIKIEINEYNFQRITKHLIPFAKHYKNISSHSRFAFHRFINKNGNSFSQEQLFKLYEIALDHEDENFVNIISQTIQKHKKNAKIEDEKILYKIFSIVFSDENENTYKQRDYLLSYKILSKKNQIEFLEKLNERLNKKFNSNLYEYLILSEIIDFQDNEWFELFVNNLYNKTLRFYKRDFKLSHEKDYPDFFIIAVQIFYLYDLFDNKKMEVFKNLPHFETWIVNPYNFDYKNFKVKWLYRKSLNYNSFMDKLKNIDSLKNIILKSLKKNPSDYKLSEIYFKFFN